MASFTIQKSVKNGVTTIDILDPTVKPMVMHYNKDEGVFNPYSPMNWLNTILLTMEELISNRSISFTLSIYLSSLSKSMVSRSSSAV